MVRVHCGPYKKDSDVCYYPFYFVVVGGEPHFGSSARWLRAECFCGCAISTLAKHVDPLNATEQDSPLRPILKKTPFKGSFLISVFSEIQLLNLSCRDAL